MDGHWHVVSTPGRDVTVGDEHYAWHETGEPCLFCGAIRVSGPDSAHITSSGLPLAVCWRNSK